MTVTTVEGVAFLHVQGDVDLASADHFRATGEQLVCSFIGTIHIDLSAITFMDSTALGALVAIRNAAETSHRVLILDRPAQPVTRLLELTALTGAFTIHREID